LLQAPSFFFCSAGQGSREQAIAAAHFWQSTRSKRYQRFESGHRPVLIAT
jgi:hypothetical protein